MYVGRERESKKRQFFAIFCEIISKIHNIGPWLPCPQVQYGGRVTDDFDKRLLVTFTNVWFFETLLQPGTDFTKLHFGRKHFIY
jgi:hypothetical protein